ncbi:hypothetical protein [Candidatus Uabimicrobium sp. HlEnr_7]|uniref:hypothetical protein n=1 Tax=Candidatus Uabimicrobium helgolandensis TaxID=3095367 RepID=UPI003557F88B
MKNTKLYKNLKSHYCKKFPNDIKNCQIRAAVQTYGYIPLAFEIAQKELSNQDIFIALDTLLEKKYNHPIEDLGYETSSWLHQEQHKIETLCMSGFRDSDRGFFRNYLIKIITTPKGNTQLQLPATTFYLLPPYRRDMAFSSVYCPISTEIDIEDEDLRQNLGWDGEKQLSFFIRLSQSIGHPIVIDLLPQVGRFSKTIFAHPECFLWNDLKHLISHLEQKIHEITERMGLQGFAPMIVRNLHGLPLFEKEEGIEKQVLNALRVEYNKRRKQILAKYKFVDGGDKGVRCAKLQEDLLQDIQNIDINELAENFSFSEEITHENFCQLYAQLAKIDFYLDKERAHFCTQQFIDSVQCEILQKVQHLIYENVGLIHDEKDLDDDEHRNLIEIFIASGLWPISGGCWNSSGYPIFRHMSTENYPVSDHYNYQGNLVSAFAGDMDIIAPWHFAIPHKHEQACNLNYHVIKKYITYCEKIYDRFQPNGFRLDHVDHSVDYPVSINEQGNPISYRAPLIVFAELAKKLRKQQPTFAFLAEYMGWGDDNNPHLYEAYAKNAIGTAISLDIVGEYRHNAKIIIEETNKRLEEFNAKQQQQSFTLTHIFDNHDRSHPDIVRALSEFNEERALLKWVKCIFLPGGIFAQRSTVYLDGNDTFTPNKEFAQIFLNTGPLNRSQNYRFFNAFSALYRHSLNDKILRYGKAELIFCDTATPESNNAVSAWSVLNENHPQQGYLVVCNEYIDDNTPSTPVTVNAAIQSMPSYEIASEILVPQTTEIIRTFDKIPEIIQTKQSKNLDINHNKWICMNLKHNEFRIFVIEAK